MSEEPSYAKTVDFLVSRLATQEVALQNSYGDTALMLAVSRSYKCSRLLCSKMKKEQLELRNKDGNTALALAVLSGNAEVCEVLVHKGACVNLAGLGEGEEGGNGQTLLHLLTRAAGRQTMPFDAFEKIYRLLEHSGVEPWQLSKEYGQSLLHVGKRVSLMNILNIWFVCILCYYKYFLNNFLKTISQNNCNSRVGAKC